MITLRTLHISKRAAKSAPAWISRRAATSKVVAYALLRTSLRLRRAPRPSSTPPRLMRAAEPGSGTAEEVVTNSCMQPGLDAPVGTPPLLPNAVQEERASV